VNVTLAQIIMRAAKMQRIGIHALAEVLNMSTVVLGDKLAGAAKTPLALEKADRLADEVGLDRALVRSARMREAR